MIESVGSVPRKRTYRCDKTIDLEDLIEKEDQELENQLAREYFKSLSYDQQQKVKKAIWDHSLHPRYELTPAQKGLIKAAREVLSDA